MPPRCPRCGAALADSASACSGCARPVTLDLTARVPRPQKRASNRPMWRDLVLLAGGIGGIACASTTENWWIAGGVVFAATLIAALLHYSHKE